jgi:hypothetical protein
MEILKCPYCEHEGFTLKLATACDPEGREITGQPVLVCGCGTTVIPYTGETSNGLLMKELDAAHSSLHCG